MSLQKFELDRDMPMDKVELMAIARATLSDRERCNCLGILALMGDLTAAEELLEMEAVLGELSSVGKELGNVIGQYLLTFGPELVEKILSQGNLPKLRNLIRHLTRLQGGGLVSDPQGTGGTSREADHLLNVLSHQILIFLHDENPACRLGVMELLRICPQVKGEWLESALQDRHLYVRVKALRLINASLEKGRPTLDTSHGEIARLVVKGIQDPSPMVREKAIYCLSHLVIPRRLDYLTNIALSNQEVVRVRLASIHVLTQLLEGEELAGFLFQLRDSNRFQIRLFVRELQCEMGQGEEAQEVDLFWGSHYNFIGNQRYQQLDQLLLRWLTLFSGESYLPSREEEEILKRIKSLSPTEEILMQILDFYLEMEERFFTTEFFRRDVTRIQRFKEILKVFGEKEIFILGQTLAVEKDLTLRLGAIEALSELALDGLQVVDIEEILLNHLNRTNNPPDQERILGVLYVFPQESYLGSVLPHLSSRSLKVMAQAASVLASFDASQVSCYNVHRLTWQIFNNIRRRKIFGKLWGDMAVYTARITAHEKCGVDLLAPYLKDDDYLVRRFAREVEHHISSIV